MFENPSDVQKKHQLLTLLQFGHFQVLFCFFFPPTITLLFDFEDVKVFLFSSLLLMFVFLTVYSFVNWI